MINKLNGDEMYHLLQFVIGEEKVKECFMKCWNMQLGVQKAEGYKPCYDCEEIGKKLNYIE